jgi:hypothetical protein
MHTDLGSEAISSELVVIASFVVPDADRRNRQSHGKPLSIPDPNVANLDPAIMARVASVEPDNAHGIVYMWGTVGIGYNKEKVAGALPTVPLTSWRVAFAPATASKLAKCGIQILDSPAPSPDSGRSSRRGNRCSSMGRAVRASCSRPRTATQSRDSVLAALLTNRAAASLLDPVTGLLAINHHTSHRSVALRTIGASALHLNAA